MQYSQSFEILKYVFRISLFSHLSCYFCCEVFFFLFDAFAYFISYI
jgi:hypothetical protein